MSEVDNFVRTARVALGLSQASLAERVGVSRQALGAIESGRSVPSTLVALRLASALETRVDALFSLPGDGELELSRAPRAGAAGAPVIVGRVGARWIGHRLGSRVLELPPDAERLGGRRVRLLRPRAELAERLFVAGCDPALGLLERLAARAGIDAVWLPMSSGEALSALARGEVHVAGCHLVSDSSAPNVDFVRRALGRARFRLVTFAGIEAGLVSRRGRGAVRRIADLARPDVRLVNRGRGAGARQLLDAELERAGLSVSDVAGYDATVAGHREVARAITHGRATVGVTTRALALAHDLRFVPIREERFDLAAPEALFADPTLARLFTLIASRALTRPLAAAGGYDVARTGQEVACG